MAQIPQQGGPSGLEGSGKSRTAKRCQEASTSEQRLRSCIAQQKALLGIFFNVSCMSHESSSESISCSARLSAEGRRSSKNSKQTA